MKTLFIFLLALVWSIQISAQTIVPTQTDELIIDNGTPAKADPGDRIRYKVSIPNTGGAAGTNVQLNAMPDPRTTLVPGSFRSSPLAIADAYAATGNVPISVPVASGLKINDLDDNTAGLTVLAETKATSQIGSVVIAADGSFIYSPPAGFTGSDSFTYTLEDGNEVTGVVATDAGTVTITVSNLIYFIDNSSAAATSDGRLTSPFKSLANFNSGSTNAGDVVYLENTDTNYAGGIVLANNERLFGEGHTGGANLVNVLNFTLATHSIALPAINGTRPVITNAGGNGIALASGNTVRGVEVGATSGAKIFGSSFGTLIVGNTTSPDVILSGNGQALNLTTGTFAATSKFVSVTTSSSGTQGINLAGIAGTVAFGSTTISGNTTQGILVGTSTANIDFGNTSVSGGTDAVSLQNNSAGTRTFGTLSTSGNSRVGFLHAVGGGLTTIAGQTTITNPGGKGIVIQDATASNGVTFADVNSTQSGDTGVLLTSNAGAVTFADLDISPDANQRGLQATRNTGTITATSGTISTTGDINITAIAVDILGTSAAILSPVAIALTSVSSNGGFFGMTLSHLSGSFIASGGSLTNASNTELQILGGTATITYSGDISNGSPGITVNIDDHDSGNITLQTGNITSTGLGIRVQNCNGGTIAFNNPSKSLSTGGNKAVTLSNNTGATINFGNGGLVITSSANPGFDATGGGTVNVTGTGNTISGPFMAINVNGTTIGAGNLNFQSISSLNSSVTVGISLENTGSSGGLVVTGTGTPGSGGTIANKTGANGSTTRGIGIYLNNTSNVSLSWMQLNDFDNFAIRGTSVVNFTLANSVINGTNGNNAGADEGSIRFNELTGSASITSSSVSGSIETNLHVMNTSGILNRLTLSSTTIGTNSTVTGDDGIFFQAQSTAVMNATVQNSFFTASRGDLAQFDLAGTGTMDIVISGTAFSNNHPAIVAEGGGVVLGATAGAMTYNVNGNTFRDATGTALAVSCGNLNPSCIGRLESNVIGVAAIANSGSTNASGIAVVNFGGGTVTSLVNNNTIRQYNHHGILLQAGQTGGNPTSFSATVTNNTIGNPGNINTDFNGIHLNNGTLPGENFTSCIDIRANSIAGSGQGVTSPNNQEFRLRQRQSTTVRLPGYGGANNNNAAVVAFVRGNQATAGNGAASNTVGSGGGGFIGGAACPTP
ncbi:MAG: Ig-like domain-containing protein [Cytophagaceae bacterium]|nr:Ig-like domain-containing protein [Cytophagaceae bacterium]